MQDSVQNFIFDNHAVRGQWIRLEHIYERVMAQHQYPAALQRLLAEAMVSVVALFSVAKFQGRLTLQFCGDGQVSLISVRCTHNYKVRGLIDWQGVVADDATLAAALGQGQLSLTFEPDNGGERYQSIVEVTGVSIAEAIEAYFMRSEQLMTRLMMFRGESQVAGLLLQVLPDDSDQRAISWEHVTKLAETLDDEEVLTHDNETLLRRLYHEETVRVFEPQPLSFGCNFTPEKMENAIIGLGHEEAMSIVDERGAIEIKCEFCSRNNRYDAVDVEQLFKTGEGGSAYSDEVVKH